MNRKLPQKRPVGMKRPDPPPAPPEPPVTGESKRRDVMNYDPNLVYCGRMTIQTVRLTFGEWQFRRTMEVDVRGNLRGFDVISAAVRNAYDELPENKPFTGKVIILVDQNGDDLAEDENEGDEDNWLYNLLLSAEIIDIKPDGCGYRKDTGKSKGRKNA